METQQNSFTQTAPTPIDVWYLDQDRAVDEMLKDLDGTSAGGRRWTRTKSRDA